VLVSGLQPPAAAGRPCLQAPPVCRAGFDAVTGATSLSALVFQIMGEERRENFPVEIQPGVAAEFHRTERNCRHLFPGRGCHGPITRKTLSLLVSLGLIAL